MISEANTSLTHFWVAKSPLVVRSKCGGVEALRARVRDLYRGRECPACFGPEDEEAKVLCAVPIGDLAPLTAFLMDAKEAGIIVGVVERVSPSRGYAAVQYVELNKPGESHEFNDRDGNPVEFTDGGYRRSEWSAGTLVRPLMEDGMSEEQNALVEAPGGPAPNPVSIKERVAAMKAKAAAKVATKGKPVAKAPKGKVAGKAKTPKEPKEQHPCLCACGGLTGGKFVPGHDARVKGWFKKIAAGDEEFTFNKLPKSLQKLVVDVKGVKKALTKPIKELGD